MPAIFCNGKFYSGQKGETGIGIDDIVQNDDNTLSIFLSSGQEIRTRALQITDTLLPVVSSADAGKILMVDSTGNWIVSYSQLNAELISSDFTDGYVSNGELIIGDESASYSDIYIVMAGRTYMIRLDETVGSCFNAMFTTDTPIGAVSNVSGVSIIDATDPSPYSMVSYTPESNGFIIITKDNDGVSGLITRVIVTA